MSDSFLKGCAVLMLEKKEIEKPWDHCKGREVSRGVGMTVTGRMA